MQLRKATMALIIKLGVREYVQLKVCKTGTIRSNIMRWQQSGAISIPKEMEQVMQTITKKTALSTFQQDHLDAMTTDGRTRDAVETMKQCMLFYIRRHRFRFADDIHDEISKSSDQIEYETMLGMFENTVSVFESKHHFFDKFVSKKRCLKKTGKDGNITVPILGPFNRYVKDQWMNRREELRTICLHGKSTDVMKLLSTEWKGDPELQTAYKTTVKQQI
jgi:hypothetical protein